MQENRQSRGVSSGPAHGGGNSRHTTATEDREQHPTINVDSIRFGEQIAPTLYSDIAEEAAKSVSPGRRASKNKPSQLRRFYDELVMLQEKVGAEASRFERQAPFIQMLKAKVAYAKGRQKVDANFEMLMRRVVDQVKDPATLKQAKLFMEAFMAFYKVYGPSE